MTCKPLQVYHNINALTPQRDNLVLNYRMSNKNPDAFPLKIVLVPDGFSSQCLIVESLLFTCVYCLFVRDMGQEPIVRLANQRYAVSRSSRADGDVLSLFIGFVVRPPQQPIRKHRSHDPLIQKVRAIVLS